jgi:hypothetical protein
MASGNAGGVDVDSTTGWLEVGVEMMEFAGAVGLRRLGRLLVESIGVSLVVGRGGL